METNIQLISNSITATAPTVLIRNAYKHYGSKKNMVPVLENLNMTVPKGVIYGLLGSSGCGKTTLLSCILGRKKLNSGKLWVLGGVPGTEHSTVPGPQIGYMPQTTGVQAEFTLRETMRYFGEIAGMTSEKITERIQFLKQLLMLPNIDMKLGNLSGGEQRRVSFAVSLLHEPELLILDEPTVGLDPLLRENIWNYLSDITANGSTTVILTTHYIDETRKANIVAMLRGGYLLAEEPPANLLMHLEAPTLEDALLILSRNQSKIESVTAIENTPFASGVSESDNLYPPDYQNEKMNHKNAFKYHHLKALFRKNCQWLLKNPLIPTSSIIVPVVQLLIFQFAIGHDPINLNLAIANNETNLKNCSTLECSSINLSCYFLKYLEESTFNLIYYDSEEEAVQSVFNGSSYASIYLRHNYSLALKERINSKNIEDWNILYSNIDVVRDLSSYQVALFTKAQLYKKFSSFIEDYLESCNRSSNLLLLPIKWNEPVYGKSLPDFAQFALPALMISAMSFFSAWATASALLSEFKEGITERTLVMGVNPTYALFSHLLSEFLLLMCHLIAVLIFAFLIMCLPLQGSLVIMIMLFILMGAWGMSFGFALSTICTSDTVATYIILGSFFPASLLSGIVWPVEGMPQVIQIFASILPFSGISDSMRSVMQRGWDLTYPQLYTSVICVTVWIAILLITSILVLKFKKS